jgi:hypothetical protein
LKLRETTLLKFFNQFLSGNSVALSGPFTVLMTNTGQLHDLWGKLSENILRAEKSGQQSTEPHKLYCDTMKYGSEEQNDLRKTKPEYCRTGGHQV